MDGKENKYGGSEGNDRKRNAKRKNVHVVWIKINLHERRKKGIYERRDCGIAG